METNGFRVDKNEDMENKYNIDEKKKKVERERVDYKILTKSIVLVFRTE